jgi:5-formyltetrahydrofolate cyclo-ligase
MLKSEIRKEIKERLNRQTKAQRLRKSLLIKEKLFKLAEFKRAKLVMFYLATEEEVQTRVMISAAQRLGKKVLLPVILKGEKKIIASLTKELNKELTRGPCGIMQPHPKYIRKIPSRLIDLVIVPALAFDRGRRRLGRGGGYYDKFLAGLSADTVSIGLAFDFQVLKKLPALSHDISVTRVISA